MSWVSNPDSALSGGWITSAYPGLGILGSAIPTTGDNGGSPVLNDGISAGKEYRWALVTPPSSGTITLYEDLTFEFSGASDGIHSATYRLWEDGVDQGTATITLQVGPSYTTISATLSNIVGAVSSVPVPRTALSATLADVFGSVSSYPSGSKLTAISATLGNIVGSVNTKSVPVTTITATLDHVTGAVSCYPSGSAFTQVNAVLAGVLGNVGSSSSGGFTGSLSDADVQRIVVAVIAALNATTIPVNIKQVNFIPIKGSGVVGDTWGPV